MKHEGLLPSRPDVTLASWQRDPQLQWTFQHVAELFPTATISPAAEPSSMPSATSRRSVADVTFTHPLTGLPTRVEDVVNNTQTHGWAVLHGNTLVVERYDQGLEAGTPHLLMSVSKSLIGTVTGSLAERRDLDVDRLVTDYVPDLQDSGYRGATVRHLLDMRSGIRFSEEYTDPRSEVRLLEQAIGWAPPTESNVADSMRGFLRSLVRDGEHGGGFDYRSCETDVLGLVCESAASSSMAALLTELLWKPMGAEYDANLAVDREGTGMFDGGISATLRDLLRFGSLWVSDGCAPDGTQVVPTDWIRDTTSGAPDSVSVFAHSKDGPWMPGGMYRNQMWFPSARRDIVLCLGIHGQMVYCNRSTGTVAAKLSGWPDPQDPHKLFGTLAAFDAVANALAT